MATTRHRRTVAVTTTALVLVVLAAAHLVLRHQRLDARAEAAALRGEERATMEVIGRLDAARAEVHDDRSSVLAGLETALARVQQWTAQEADERARLHRRRDERQELVAALEAAQSDLWWATARTQQNDQLLQALDRCLDGAAGAGNALSVGDENRAFASLREVRDACAQVDAAVGR